MTKSMLEPIKLTNKNLKKVENALKEASSKKMDKRIKQIDMEAIKKGIPLVKPSKQEVESLWNIGQ
ncbi:hypothetical protein CQA49_09625 [Helicobacter sp. MIT 00-7814]|uniref:hypothetical protein n=1 Tax=unclassified Helicobacter TaxID=2593540 RepID=UPI000E1E76AC|nr:MULTISPECIES: hypothetical protein [unclassified Helicobacter]RDU51324.1 hypothetical protein CQA37_09790 [Helicobacter sp. MIT 99-10781]RDU51423.1 hypothetical protein CQA49_09625 [Helicobacter sp. MIT 00-7814]